MDEELRRQREREKDLRDGYATHTKNKIDEMEKEHKRIMSGRTGIAGLIKDHDEARYSKDPIYPNQKKNK